MEKEERKTHRFIVRRSKRGKILFAISINENEIEEFNKKYKNYFIEVKKRKD